MKKVLVACLFVFFILSSAAFADVSNNPPAPPSGLTMQESSGPSAGSVVGDILARPFLVSGAMITTAFGVVTMPAVFLTGLGEQWAYISIEAPWRFAVGRPLGEWNTYRDGGPITILHR